MMIYKMRGSFYKGIVVNILTIVCVFILVSCDGSRSKSNSDDNFFRITIQLKTSNEDRFRIVLKNVDNDVHNNETTVLVDNECQVIKGGQMIDYDYEFPSSVYLTLGYREVKLVEIESIEISFNDRSRYFNSKDINESFFKLNKYAKFGSVPGQIRTENVDGKHRPILFFKREVINQFN
jgi:hypothetical protein